MTDKPDRTCCQVLPWDSEFFGLRIARLTAIRVDPALWSSAEAWCSENAVDCIYFLADPSDDEAVRTVEESRFRMVDIRITFERRITGNESVSAEKINQEQTDSRVIVRPCRAGDLDALGVIARTNHRDSRFYHDGNFPAARCDDLFETWIRRSFSGLAEAVFVADVEGRPVGYITCVRSDDRTGQIGLFGMAADFRGTGMAVQLLGRGLMWALEKGLDRMTVATQGRNIKAQRFYQHCGFLSSDLKIWYHRWFKGNDADSI